MGSALLLHHVLADQWVVVIIILIFSTKENMFVEHTENMMMDIFWEFHDQFEIHYLHHVLRYPISRRITKLLLL